MLSKSSQENHHPSNLPSALEAHQLKTESDEKIETRQDTGEEKPGGKRIRYQKASFAMRAKLVQMVNNEGFSIRQVFSLQPKIQANWLNFTRLPSNSI